MAGQTAGIDTVQLRDYENLVRLASGGSSTVYRALDARHGRDVAVKVLNQSVDEDATRQRFNNEIASLTAFGDHPGIVTVLDSGFIDDGRPFIVTPLFRQGTYADLVSSEGPLVWQEAADVMSRVAGAVAAVHDAGLLHRDIKPANIFIGAHESGPVLSDFGVSSRADPMRTASENPALTILYAAPEILDAERASPASDIYALGATFYALVNGAPAYWHESVAETMRSKLDAAFPPPVTGQTLPSAVAEYIARLMSRDASKRPASAVQVAEDLTGLVSRGTDAVTTTRYQARTAELLAAGELTTPIDRLESRPPLRSSLPSEELAASATVNEVSGRTGAVNPGARLGRFRLAAGVAAALAVGGALLGAGYLISVDGEPTQSLVSTEVQAVEASLDKPSLQSESTPQSRSADAPEGAAETDLDVSLQPLLNSSTSASLSDDESASLQRSAGNKEESSEVTLPGSPTTLASSGASASSTTTTRSTATVPALDCSRWYRPARSEEVATFEVMTIAAVEVRRAPLTDEACKRGVSVAAETTVAVHAERGGWSYTYNSRTDDWGWLPSSSLGPVVTTQPSTIDCSQWYLPNGNEKVAPYEATAGVAVAVRRAPSSDAACKRGVTLAAETTVMVHAERDGWLYTYHAAADDWGWVVASALG